MTEDREYILGTDRRELERLEFQHIAWSEQAHAIIRRAGIKAGDRVLDLGSGPGYTSIELAHVVGEAGQVVARDVSERFLACLSEQSASRGLAQIKPSLGAVEDLAFDSGSFDAAYARWLFCWLPDPRAALASVARCLRPGGTLVLQEYLDWGAMKLIPREDTHDAVVGACMQSWAVGGGDIDVGARIPVLADELGLVVECFEPICRLGEPGSMVWRWLGGFYESYLPRLVERGALDAALLARFTERWAQLSHDEQPVRIQAPIMVNVVLRRR